MLILGPFRSPAVCPEANTHIEHVETTCYIHRNIIWCEANEVWPVWCGFLRKMKFIIFVLSTLSLRDSWIPSAWNTGVCLSCRAMPHNHLVMWHCAELISLRWRHNGRDSISNHQPRDFGLNRLFRRRSKKTSKLRVTGLCARNSPVTGEIPAQMASNAKNVSIWWRHHDHCRWWPDDTRGRGVSSHGIVYFVESCPCLLLARI